MTLLIKMVLDSDGIKRPRQTPRTHAQNIEHFNNNYTVIDRGFETPCWEWKNPGYGGYGFMRVNYKHTRAHRFSLLEHKGLPPDGKPHALHKCSNPPCVNPDHLYWGDKQDNWRDANEAGVIMGARGEDHPKCKLTKKLVIKIREEYASGVAGYKKLGKMYGVDEKTIRCIVQRKTWKHVQ